MHCWGDSGYLSTETSYPGDEEEDPFVRRSFYVRNVVVCARLPAPWISRQRPLKTQSKSPSFSVQQISFYGSLVCEHARYFCAWRISAPNQSIWWHFLLCFPNVCLPSIQSMIALDNVRRPLRNSINTSRIFALGIMGMILDLPPSKTFIPRSQPLITTPLSPRQIAQCSSDATY